MSPSAAPPQPWEAKPVRDVVRVEGSDARSFLQGQLSQDVSSLGPGEAVWSFVLQPTGKVDTWVRIEALGDETFALDVDGGWGQVLLDRLSRFKMRVKVELSLEPGGREVPTPEGPDAYEATRIRAGIPAMGAELTESTIPAEAGQWIVDASVSFTKGCFTGQELVARIDSRGGNVPRHLRVVELGVVSGRPSDAGAEVLVDGEVVGTLTSVAPDGFVALAYVSRAVSPPAQAKVVVPGRQDQDATLR